MLSRFMISGLAVLMFLPAVAFGSDYEGFAKEIIKPYGFYKKALSLTQNKEDIKAAREMTSEFVAHWKPLAQKYTADVPKPFADIEGFKEMLERGSTIGDEALEALGREDVGHAHMVLEGVRYMLWDIRVRAGIDSAMDRANEFHEAMEVALQRMASIQTPQEAKDTGHRYGMWLKITWEALALSNDPAVRDNKDFALIALEGRAAIASLRLALEAGDIKAAKSAMSQVKGAYKKVFSLPI